MKTTLMTQLARWGNSLAVRIPKQVVETARLKEGEPLSLSVGKARSVVMRPSRRKYRLEELVSKIKPANRHDATDWGPAVGKEIW